MSPGVVQSLYITVLFQIVSDKKAVFALISKDLCRFCTQACWFYILLADFVLAFMSFL